jgi:hypothetical protein
MPYDDFAWQFYLDVWTIWRLLLFSCKSHLVVFLSMRQNWMLPNLPWSLLDFTLFFQKAQAKNVKQSNIYGFIELTVCYMQHFYFGSCSQWNIYILLSSMGNHRNLIVFYTTNLKQLCVSPSGHLINSKCLHNSHFVRIK